ncbi:MAG: copper resistance protein B [Planctomycetota bacterium]|nr:copper resistance protein B [Planctomycetota bacterium]
MKLKRLQPLLVLTFAVALVSFGSSLRAEVVDDQLFTLVKIDQLEVRFQDGDDVAAWDGQARIGTDRHKLAVKSEGEYVVDPNHMENAEVQFLYLRLISDFFDAQIGVRHDFEPDPSRTFAVVGINGLAPQWFEVDASLFLSDEGDVSARFEVEYDILITQRLVLQPDAEINVAFSDDEPTGVGSGVSNVELGLRLRYEFAREFAPYLGINWERKLGNTSDFARAEGEDDNVFSVVAGLRIFF